MKIMGKSFSCSMSGKSLLISITLLATSTASAIPMPLRDITKLPLQGKELAYHVKGAKVIIADYGLIRRDFEATRSLTDTQIDAWLLKNGALMAKSQCEIGEKVACNSAIDADDKEPVTVFRPINYGRAFVTRIGTDAGGDLLLDMKAVGARKPKRGGHTTGLSSLYQLVREYAFQKLIQKVFIHSKSGYDTVEFYAVIDLGFKVNEAEGWLDAGMALRQAHKRYEHLHYQLADSVVVEIEKVLRRYGITSCGMQYDPNSFNCFQDLQGTDENAVIDFGTYIALEKFKASLLGMEPGPDGGDKILLDRRSRNFVQPNPGLLVTIESWGSRVVDGRVVDGPANWAFRWSNGIHNGIEDKAQFASFLDHLLQVEMDRWKVADKIAADRALAYRIAADKALADRIADKTTTDAPPEKPTEVFSNTKDPYKHSTK